MIIVLFGFLIVWCFIFFIIGIIQYIKNPKPPNGLTYYEYKQYYIRKEWQHDNESDNIHESERVMLLDETIVKYNRLLDALNDQYKNTWNESEKNKILAKQIATMEKLNRALEKREKLDN